MSKKLTGAIMALFLVCFVVYNASSDILDNINYTQEESIKEECYVKRVVDGDTLVVDYMGEERKVRLIGIDTPESVHSDKSKNTEEGKIASEFTKGEAEGKKVVLEFDKELEDRYGRLLAYVYIDGKMLNKTLIENGYAVAKEYPPNIKYADEFKDLEKKYKEN